MKKINKTQVEKFILEHEFLFATMKYQNDIGEFCYDYFGFEDTYNWEAFDLIYDLVKKHYGHLPIESDKIRTLGMISTIPISLN